MPHLKGLYIVCFASSELRKQIKLYLNDAYLDFIQKV